jgi:hypothetical protein
VGELTGQDSNDSVFVGVAHLHAHRTADPRLDPDITVGASTDAGFADGLALPDRQPRPGRHADHRPSAGRRRPIGQTDTRQS